MTLRVFLSPVCWVGDGGEGIRGSLPEDLWARRGGRISGERMFGEGLSGRLDEEEMDVVVSS